MKINKLKKFEDFKVGDLASFSKLFKSSSLKSFQKLSGDNNPLHCDPKYAKKTEFGKLVVPVHMVIAPFSRIAGMIFPGKPSLYLSQEVKAIKPVFFDEELKYSAKIVAINALLRTLSINILVIRGTDVVVNANILVKATFDSWEQDIDEHVTHSQGNCLITGATGEIGGALAVKMAATGVDLILQCREGGEKRHQLEEKLSKILAKNQKCTFITGDLMCLDVVKNLCNLIKDQSVEYFVHLASPPLRSEVEDLVKVNYSALEAITRTLIPGMLLRQGGVVVSIGSVATEKFIPGWQHYSAAKAMANQYISSIDKNYSEHGIRGLTILLGLVSTGFSKEEQLSSPAMLPEEAASLIKNLVIERKFGQSVVVDIGEEVHGVVGFSPIRNQIDKVTAEQSKIDLTPKSSHELLGGPSLQKNTENLLFEVESLIKNLLKLSDKDITNGALGVTPGWDSLRHIEIILELEKNFDCKFSSTDIDSLTSIRDIVSTLSRISSDL